LSKLLVFIHLVTNVEIQSSGVYWKWIIIVLG
jgi:hypothetical protein